MAVHIYLPAEPSTDVFHVKQTINHVFQAQLVTNSTVTGDFLNEVVEGSTIVFLDVPVEPGTLRATHKRTGVKPISISMAGNTKSTPVQMHNYWFIQGGAKALATALKDLKTKGKI